MKKNVILYGLLSGLVITMMMVVTTSMCYHNADFQSSMFLGFATMIFAFSSIFIAVKNVRDKHNRGRISFGKAFKTGLYISLIGSTIYVVAWVIDYYIFIPDFMDKYTAHVLKEAHAAGGTPQQFSAKIAEMNSYKEMYKNPVYVVLLTYMEVLPVALIISLVSALIFKRK